MISIVIVDDEVLSRLGLRTFLESQTDFSVQEEFGSAQDALDYLKKNGPVDVAITDIEMADINGIDFIRELRKNSLAGGVIIVSCHNDFHYAQDAISAGADAYLLKQDISQNELVKAVREAYQKRAKDESQPIKRTMDIAVQDTPLIKCSYAVGLIRFYQNGITDLNGMNINESMLEHLLENIVRRHGIGTLFVPYKSDMFVLFQFDKDEAAEEKRKKIIDFASDLSENVRLYTNHSVILGVSGFFSKTSVIRDEYDNALEAASLSFYNEQRTLSFYDDMSGSELPQLHFTTDGFLDEGGAERFRQELNHFLDTCRTEHQPAGAVKEALENQVSQFMWGVLQEYRFPEKLQQKWNSRFSCRSVISSADDLEEIRDGLSGLIKRFQLELLTWLRQDELEGAIQYVNDHLEEKLNLQTLADMSCMSITTFCRKFKEKTGMTLVQYINRQKVEEVKKLLHRNMTLEEIADRAGFCSVNYMIRVFKKTDGRTVTEYRKDCREGKT